MARRKDHAPEELRGLIRVAAQKIIYTKGLDALTARNLAQKVGYTPGTIYNFYRDMDALVTEVNFITLDRLEQACRERIDGLPPTFEKVKALAYAYADFAHDNVRAWEAIFMHSRQLTSPSRLPKSYQKKLADLFYVIENVLTECLKISSADAHKAARLLWACLHGITVLTLDGRLRLIGVEKPHLIIDDLLEKYFATYREAK